MIQVRATTSRFARTTTSAEITEARTRLLASEGKKVTQGRISQWPTTRIVG
jgi:hypothetical protein